MQRTYNEKLLEDFIKRYPKDFLSEDLSFVSQQPIIGGFRPDLIFRDVASVPVIVEVQLNALDRNHLYRILEYKDLLLENSDFDVARTIIVSNSVPVKYQRLLRVHNIEYISISKEEFLEKARLLDPEVDISFSSGASPVLAEEWLTAANVLSQLSPKKKEQNTLDLEAVVFWTSERGYNAYNFRYENLYEIENQRQAYFNDWRLFPRKAGTDSDLADLVNVPNEILVSTHISRTLNRSNLHILSSWMNFLGKYARYKEYEDEEVVFGCRGYDDLYDYEVYIRDRIRVLRPLWFAYDLENGYDADKIQEDLSLLQSIKLYAGKYPNYSEVTFCSEFEIVRGPGSLLKNWQRRRKLLIDLGYSDEVKRLEDQAFDCEWTTVRIKRLCNSYVRTMRDLFEHLAWSHLDANSGELRLDKKCHLCLKEPAFLRHLDPEALELSARFFSHLKKLEDTT